MSSLGWRRIVGSVAAGLVFGGCSGADVAKAEAPVEAADAATLGQLVFDIGQPCPGMTGAAVPGELDEIFVEAALVDAPSALAEHVTLADLPELARSRRARLVGAPHVIGKFDAETSVSLGANADQTTPVALARLSVLPRHVDDDTSMLELELELSAQERSSQVPAAKTLRFSVTTRDNEPGVAHMPWHEAGKRSLIVAFRTFRVRGEAELRAIFECKMQQRVRYLQRMSRPAVP